MGVSYSYRRHDQSIARIAMKYLLQGTVVAAFLTPIIALAETPRTWEQLANRLIYIMDYAIGSVVVLAIVIYFFGVLTNTRKAQEGDSSEIRTFMLWGLIAIFVMVSVWGILQILRATLFSGEGFQTTSSGTDAPCNFGSC